MLDFGRWLQTRPVQSLKLTGYNWDLREIMFLDLILACQTLIVLNLNYCPIPSDFTLGAIPSSTTHLALSCCQLTALFMVALVNVLKLSNVSHLAIQGYDDHDDAHLEAFLGALPDTRVTHLDVSRFHPFVSDLGFAIGFHSSWTLAII
ncbi:Aste57867_9169 [Aphanomyces stellatus]|uniref:Aste57867_9169 protein n=1 Tax=Aphanomyces stellatus TaxID=120398 RepID=A0A485KMJ4_9STRA|nr:hypothetical protein As57867_009133 [Aphanomyces stellatus]VFT86053.1 Aste57867_9169 [Aphanomyces stellatus]